MPLTVRGSARCSAVRGGVVASLPSDVDSRRRFGRVAVRMSTLRRSDVSPAVSARLPALLQVLRLLRHAHRSSLDQRRRRRVRRPRRQRLPASTTARSRRRRRRGDDLVRTTLAEAGACLGRAGAAAVLRDSRLASTNRRLRDERGRAGSADAVSQYI